jgi:class 3 adenylate cyclase
MEEAILWVKMVATFAPALVLFLIDLWLRSRKVKDPTLLWLYIGLIFWGVSAFLATEFGSKFIPNKYMESLDARKSFSSGLFSPLNNIAFVLATFNLSRIKDDFIDKQGKGIKNSVLILIVILSVITYIFFFLDKSKISNSVDYLASSISFLCLGAGISYSFWKYDNRWLAGLSAFTSLFLIILQSIKAIEGKISDSFIEICLSVGGPITFGMLFLALSIFWSLSVASKLRIVGTQRNVNVVALIFDLRKSTQWVHEVHGNIQVINFMNDLRDWILEKSRKIMNLFKKPKLLKFLGDGYLIIWEQEGLADELNQAVAFSCSICNEYNQFRDQLINTRKFASNLPSHVGIGIDFGTALKLTHENGSYDYISSSINNASKFQLMARPMGGVVISENLWKNLNSELKQRFNCGEKLKIAPDVEMSVKKMKIEE